MNISLARTMFCSQHLWLPGSSAPVGGGKGGPVPEHTCQTRTIRA